MLPGTVPILVLFVMVVLVQMNDLTFRSPACGYCNRKGEHAKDCKLRKRD